MDARWKLELWLDDNLEPVQVNTVLVDNHGKLLEIQVIPTEPGSLVGALVQKVFEGLGVTAQPRLPFDGSEWSSTGPRG